MRVSRSSGTGTYDLRINLTRGVQLESDASYSNNNYNSANTLPFTTTGNAQHASIAGTIMGSEGNTTDLDDYQLGALNAGISITLGTRLPSWTTLEPQVRVYRLDGSNNRVYMTDTDPSDGGFSGTADANGNYYAEVYTTKAVLNGVAIHLQPHVADLDGSGSVGGHGRWTLGIGAQPADAGPADEHVWAEWLLGGAERRGDGRDVCLERRHAVDVHQLVSGQPGQQQRQQRLRLFPDDRWPVVRHVQHRYPRQREPEAGGSRCRGAQFRRRERAVRAGRDGGGHGATSGEQRHDAAGARTEHQSTAQQLRGELQREAGDGDGDCRRLRSAQLLVPTVNSIRRTISLTR